MLIESALCPTRLRRLSLMDLRMPAANPSSPFYRALDRCLNWRRVDLHNLCPPGDEVAQRVLHDYGAIHISVKDTPPPPLYVFTNDEQVYEFQHAAGWTAAAFGDAVVELQPAAMSALLRARAAARAEGLDISPRDGAEAARRS